MCEADYIYYWPLVLPNERFVDYFWQRMYKILINTVVIAVGLSKSALK